MAYNPATDFVGLWRAITSGVEKAEMPGLDFVVAALGRAGILNPMVVSGSPPVVNQDITAWFRTATPDWEFEGALYLWDAASSTYLPATPALFLAYLGANSTNGAFLTIYAGNGVPDNAIGVNGDYYLRLDAPGGIYGPKAAGSWPANPLPGTSYSQISAFLDFLGTAQGDIVYRNASAWVVLAPGTAGNILSTGGAGANPSWISSSTLVNAGLDAIGNVQGDILYRNATVWTVLAPGTAGQLLQTGGAGANPSWVNTSSFTLTSAQVDAAFGATAGGVLVRGAAWTNSGAGSSGQVLTSNGASAPTFQAGTTSASLDALFGAVQGSVIYRNASAWVALGPGTAGYVLTTAGAGANPGWAPPATPAPVVGGVGTYAMIDDNGSGLTLFAAGTVWVSNGVPVFSGGGPAIPVGSRWMVMGNLSVAFGAPTPNGLNLRLS